MKVDTGVLSERKVNADKLLPESEVGELIQMTIENGKKDRTGLRSKRITTLIQKEKKPHEIFDAIIGDRTRADNLSCCYNLEVDHELISDYLRKLAQNTNEDSSMLFNMLADMGERVRESRSIVTRLMVIDQLTNIANYDRDTFQRSVNDSSLGVANKDATISQRTWPEGVNYSYATELQGTRDDIKQWNTDSIQNALIIRFLIPYIYTGSPKLPSGLRIALLDDTDATSSKFVNALTKNEQWVASSITQLVEGIDEKTILELFENLTFAQQVLEEQYYYLGLGLLRANETGSLPESVSALIKRISQK